MAITPTADAYVAYFSNQSPFDYNTPAAIWYLDDGLSDFYPSGCYRIINPTNEYYNTWVKIGANGVVALSNTCP